MATWKRIVKRLEDTLKDKKNNINLLLKEYRKLRRESYKKRKEFFNKDMLHQYQQENMKCKLLNKIIRDLEKL